MERDRFRSYPRFAERVRICIGLETGVRFFAETINLSTAGALIETSHPLDEDSILSLKILLPGRKEPLLCRGKVVWLNHSKGGWSRSRVEVGVEFVDLSCRDRVVLQEYLQRIGTV